MFYYVSNCFQSSVVCPTTFPKYFETNKQFEKCKPSFMESLIANFIQFSDAIAKLLFLQRRLGTRVCVHSVS